MPNSKTRTFLANLAWFDFRNNVLHFTSFRLAFKIILKCELARKFFSKKRSLCFFFFVLDCRHFTLLVLKLPSLDIWKFLKYFGSRVRLREKADYMIVAGQILTAKRWLKYQLVNYLSALTEQQQFQIANLNINALRSLNKRFMRISTPFLSFCTLKLRKLYGRAFMGAFGIRTLSSIIRYSLSLG